MRAVPVELQCQSALDPTRRKGCPSRDDAMPGGSGERKKGRCVRSEDGVGEFEESVAPAVEASVERVAEAVENIGRFHDVPIMHSPTALRTPYLPVELKCKL